MCVCWCYWRFISAFVLVTINLKLFLLGVWFSYQDCAERSRQFSENEVHGCCWRLIQHSWGDHPGRSCDNSDSFKNVSSYSCFILLVYSLAERVPSRKNFRVLWGGIGLCIGRLRLLEYWCFMCRIESFKQTAKSIAFRSSSLLYCFEPAKDGPRPSEAKYDWHWPDD